MSTDLTSQMQNIRDKIRERIQASIVELIPEEVFQQMVETEIKWFLNDPGTSNDYRHYTPSAPSPLRLLIRDELNRVYKEKLTEFLSSPEAWGKITYNNGTNPYQEPSDFIKRVMVEHGADIWAAVMARQFQGVLEVLRNNINSLRIG